MNQKSRKDLARKEQESNEGQDAIKVDAPASRVQSEAQQPDAALQGSIETGKEVEPYMKKKVKATGHEVKQDKVAEVVTKAAPSGSIPAFGESRSISFSGDDGIIAGALQSTPVVGKDTRPSSRFGKKMDVYIKNIDYNPSEQFVREEDGAIPLSEAKDAVQGYRGTIRNDNTLVQKVSGAVPGSLNFERSLDQIGYDLFMFSRGQIVKQNGVGTYLDTPTLTVGTTKFEGMDTAIVYDRYGNKLGQIGQGEYADMTKDDIVAAGLHFNYGVERGNYWNHTFHFSYDSDGRITKFYFDTMNLSTATGAQITSDVINKSATHALTHINRNELARQRIDAEAGDEVTSKYWSPLARAVEQPSQTVAYLNDIEAMGNHVFTAYKMASTAQCKVLNDGAKNGIHPRRALKEYLLGDIIPEFSSSVYSSIEPFNPDLYAQGALSFAIALNDTVGKYHTIGNALTLPLSIRSYIQTADNVMDVFKVDKDFAAMLNANVAFSTIDHAYDPLSPVLFTEKVAIIDPYNWNDLFSFKSLDTNGDPIFSKPIFAYSYEDIRNNYTVTVYPWLLKGLYEFLKSKMIKLLDIKSLIGKDIAIPIRYSADHPSLWEILLLGATKYMVYERTNSCIDVLRLEENYSYPYNDLISIKNANPLNCVNYTIKSLLQPLEIKTMMPSAAIRVIWPEVFTTMFEDTNKQWTLLPWYFNEFEYKSNSDGANAVATGDAVMSFPTIASGIRSSYADVLYSMSERDIRLCLDRITYLPIPSGTPMMVYKYDKSSDGIPVLPFGDGAMNMALETYLSLPRELGWSFIAPAGVITPIVTGTQEIVADATTDVAEHNFTYAAGKYYYKTLDRNRIYPGFRLKYYFTSGKSPLEVGVLSDVDMNLARGTSFAQDYNYLCSTPFYMSQEQDPGFVLSYGQLFTRKALADGKSLFIPFCYTDGAKNYAVSDAKYKLASLQKGLWTRIQRLPFAISPWDAAVEPTSAGNDDGNATDPFDFMYMMGLKGFRASDYNEDVYNKENSIIELGYAYVNDPFVEDSPLVKDARTYTNV